MYPIFTFIEDLYEYLTKSRCVKGSIIRKHSKRLDDLGDLSFPLNVKNWCQVFSKTDINVEHVKTIFDIVSPHQDKDAQITFLIERSQKWELKIHTYKIKENDIHLFLLRPYTIDLTIKYVLEENFYYGIQQKYFYNKINITTNQTLNDDKVMNLTELRLLITKNTASNLINALTEDNSQKECDIKIVLNSNEKQQNVLVCGSVLNENGVKNNHTTAAELYKKRALDMQLMAQHKYGMQIKPSWAQYFHKLGTASVTVEMLQNRTHKSTKITLNNLQTTNKGPSFIFYNCARISALLKHFDEMVSNNLYPEIPPIEKIDFSLINQPEEWELVFVYLLQFPAVVISCVCDIESGIINLHNLVTFLANLSSVFSVYYRRVKILTNKKEHLLPVLYARIYLLKAVQQVFYTALRLLNIEPIKEM